MKSYLLVFIFLLCSTISFAQTQDVKLTVSGQGKTEEEAVNNALRLAVEEAYGVFVSTNTEILNDELVRDEIATVTSGNIKSFSIISSTILSSGLYNATLETIVSVSALKNYVVSHGGDCEFNGAVFGANVKLFEINRKNAEMVMEHLMEEITSMSSRIYNYSLTVSEPKMNGDVAFNISVATNDNYKMLIGIFDNFLSSIAIEEVEANRLINQGAELFRYEIYSLDDEFVSKFRYSKYLLTPIPSAINTLLYPKNEMFVQDNIGNEYIVKLDTYSNSGHKQGLQGRKVYLYDTNWSKCIYSQSETKNIPISILSQISSFMLLENTSYSVTTRESVKKKQDIDLLFKSVIKKMEEEDKGQSKNSHKKK